MSVEPALVNETRLSVDPALVNETRWRVTNFEHGILSDGINPPQYHPVDWVFHLNNTVNAGHLWTNVWVVSGENRIKVASSTAALAVGQFFEVVFLSSRWFVATWQGDDLYRLGQRARP